MGAIGCRKRVNQCQFSATSLERLSASEYPLATTFHVLYPLHIGRRIAITVCFTLFYICLAMPTGVRFIQRMAWAATTLFCIYMYVPLLQVDNCRVILYDRSYFFVFAVCLQCTGYDFPRVNLLVFLDCIQIISSKIQNYCCSPHQQISLQ